MPPYILCLLDSREIMLFPDLGSLESAIEAIDVKNLEYLAYDSAGYVLDLTVDEFGAPRARQSAVSKAEDLRSWIVENYGPYSQVRKQDTLPKMISVLKSIYKYS